MKANSNERISDQPQARITKKNIWDWESKGFLCEICIKLEEINEDDYKNENVSDRIKTAYKELDSHRVNIGAYFF